MIADHVPMIFGDGLIHAQRHEHHKANEGHRYTVTMICVC
jgi:hypothetical protein